MEQELKSHLERLGGAFAEARGLALSTVGRLVANDSRFFARLDDGKTLTIRKFDEVLAWFSANWPAGVDWPEDVPRPEPQTAEAAE